MYQDGVNLELFTNLCRNIANDSNWQPGHPYIAEMTVEKWQSFFLQYFKVSVEQVEAFWGFIIEWHPEYFAKEFGKCQVKESYKYGQPGMTFESNILYAFALCNSR